MKPLPLRWLMLWPILLTVVVGFVAFAIFIDKTVHDDLVARIDDELGRATRGRQPLPAPGDQPTPAPDVSDLPATDAVDAPAEIRISPSGSVQRLNAAPMLVTDEQLIALLGTNTVLTIEGEEAYRVSTSTSADGVTTLTGLPLTDVESSISNLRRGFVAGGIVILLLETIVVWLISTMVTRPVTRLAEQAALVADGDLDAEINSGHRSRETADLAEDLRVMLAQLRLTLDASERSAIEATTANESLLRFLADASHELRTPLTAIRGYAELYANEMLSEAADLDRAMSRVGSESQRLTALVNDMLLLAKSELPTAQPDVRVDLGAVAADVVHDLRAAHPTRGIELRVDPTVDAHVRGVVARLHQAVMNLVANAIHHTDSDVGVELVNDGAHVRLSVIDHGPGIPAADVERIFQPFFRGDSSRARTSDGGSGLGLALTQQIVGQHGATLHVQDTPGGGATFCMELPSSSTDDT